MMNYESEDGKIIIRPSSISTFMNCPYKWYLHNVQGVPMIPNVKMVAGTATHKGAEVGYTEKIKTGKLPPESVMKDAAVEEFHRQLKEEEAKVEEDEDVNEYEKIVVENIDLYKPAMEATQPKSVERHFKKPVESEMVEALEGTADIIGERLVIDIKTTLRKAVPKDYTLQLSAYALLAEAEGIVVTMAKIHNIVNGKAFYELPLKLEKERAQFLIDNLIRSVDEVLVKGVDPELVFRGNPTSFLCSEKYCTHYKECKFVKGEA